MHSIVPRDKTEFSKLSNNFRNRRFSMFMGLIKELPTPVRIIDIGGTEEFWTSRGMADNSDFDIVAINLEATETAAQNIKVVAGDATSLEFGDNSFDVAFSNSVIEHLFTYENQRAMAREILRVAPRHWVQTPSYWCPMEPHFHFIGWHWLPRSARISLLRKRRFGWRGPEPDKEKAAKLVDEVRIMTKLELQKCFPGSSIFTERYAMLPKSYVAFGGFS